MIGHPLTALVMLSVVAGCLVDNKRYMPELATDSGTTTTGSPNVTSGVAGITGGSRGGGASSDSSDTGFFDGPASEGPIPPGTGTNPGEPWWDAAWPYRRQVLFSLPPGPALEDFPVPVRLSPIRRTGLAMRDGSDLRFVTEGGVIVPHEVEAWQSGDAIAWVTLPSLDPLALPELMIYYGNADARPATDQLPFYSDYVGVWHLSDGTDSSGSGFSVALPGEAVSPGFVGWGARLLLAQEPLLAPEFNVDPSFEEAGFTFSAWAQIDETDGDVASLYCRSTDTGGLTIEVELSTGTVIVTRRDLDGLHSWLFPAGVAPNQWAHVFVRYGGGTPPSVLVDAIPIDLDTEASDPGPPALTAEPGLTLGGYCYDGPRTFAGVLDDVRVSSVRRDDAWGLLLHEASAGSITTLGELEEFPG